MSDERKTYEIPCRCGANEWGRYGDEDTSLMVIFRCKRCGEEENCE